jgi:hypothetical protein
VLALLLGSALPWGLVQATKMGGETVGLGGFVDHLRESDLS